MDTYYCMNISYYIEVVQIILTTYSVIFMAIYKTTYKAIAETIYGQYTSSIR
jgi:hypothetical protein